VAWKISARVGAPAFPAAQGRDHDHQTNEGRIAGFPLRQRKWQQFGRRQRQTLAIAQNAGGFGENLAYRRGIAGNPRPRRDTWFPPAAGRGPFDAFGNKTAADGGFEQGIAGEAIGAVQARARRLATSPKTFDRCAPGQINGDAAHMIMRRRADRYRLRDGIDTSRVAKARDGRKAARKIEA
jgi:hypothetical protein